MDSNFLYSYVQQFYSEPHRKYHTFKHIKNMISWLDKHYPNPSNELYHAILFHDVVYNPYDLHNNKKQSCELYKRYHSEYKYSTDRDKVCYLIMATKNHFKKDLIGDEFLIVNADLSIFEDKKKILEYERGILFEYQKVPIVDYVKHRIAFLKRAKNFFGNETLRGKNCQFLIDYLSNKIYKVGIYAGSFNPFHKGHLNIVEQAEKVFDKVILAQGFNPEKSKPFELKTKIRQIEIYPGLIIDLFCHEDGIEKYLIRGLRNGFDVNYESMLRSFINDTQEVPVILFLCDKQYEHVSSTLIRSLQQHNENIANKYLPEII